MAELPPEADSEAVDLLRTMEERPHDASPRDLGESQVSSLREFFETEDFGLYFFCIFICGFKDLTLDLHLPLCQLVSKWGQSILKDGRTITTPPNDDAGEYVEKSYRRIMVRIPREHFKTSVCTRGNALWTLARDPTHDPTIGIFNEKEDNPKSWIQAILDTVESSLLFQRIWREMIPKGIGFWDKDANVTKDRNWKWGAGGALFVRNATGVPELSLEPHGISGTAVGRHYTHMILDDIIGRNAAQSPALMEAANNWVDNSRPLERPAENGCQIVPHTPWGYSDTYSHMLKKWPGEYQVWTRSILENPETGQPDAVNGKAIYPAKISTKKAKKLLRTDSFVNWAQYMCLPRAGKQQDFSESWLRYGKVIRSGEEPVFIINDAYYDPQICDLDCGEDTAPQFIPLSWMHKAVILDPAPSKPTEQRAEPSAGNGIVAVGKDPWGRRFLLDCLLLREEETEIVRRCLNLCVEWGLGLIGVEEVNFSALYFALFEYIARLEFDIRPDYKACYTQGRQKPVRIKNNLRPAMQDGFWYLNSATTAKATQEVLEYPNSETQDIVDALAYTDEVLYRPETPAEVSVAAYRRRVSEQDRGITGYGEFM